jgi:protein-tyrosine-phosphatase
MKTILLVCTANQCRSPMAEGLMRRKLEREGRAGEIRAASAGVDALDGCRATENSIQAMAARGIDISGHRSRAATDKILQDAALILTMERAHAHVLQALFPAHAERVHLLAQMAGLESDVADPVGSPLENYRRTAQEIENLIELGYHRMMQLIGE